MTAGSPTSPVLDFTSLDYESAISDLMRFLQARSGINITNLNPSDPMMVLQQSLAYITDLLAYTENQHTSEAIPSRALRMANFRAAAKGFGFTPKGIQASAVEVTLVLDPTVLAVSDIEINTHHQVSSEDGLIFQPTTAVTIPLGTVSTTLNLDVSQGEEVFGEVIASASPGTESQNYVLSRGPVLDESVIVSVDGVAWEKVAILALEDSDAKVYAITYDENSIATVVFGDGLNGVIPPTGQPIVATYKIGGGDETNVAPGSINVLTNMPAGVLSCTNTFRAEGGSPPESLAVAKGRLPGASRANDRGVAAEDYAALATAVGGIAKAVSVRGPSGIGGCGHSIVVYAAPEGGFTGGGLTPTHVSQIIANTRPKSVTGKKILVRAAMYGQLVIDLDVFVQTGVRANDVRIAVQTAVLDAYDFTSLDFGSELAVQSLYTILLPTAVRGVSRVILRQFTVLPYMGLYVNYTPTGNGTMVYPVPTVSTLRREWKITFTDAGGLSGPAVFTVTQRILGTASEVSDTTVQDESADYGVNSLTTTADGWVFRYLPYDSDTGTRNIVGNTSTSLSVSGGDLQDVVQPGDAFVIEKTQVATGKVYQNAWTAPGGGYTAGATLAAPGAYWLPGNVIRLVTSSGIDATYTVTGGTVGAWTVTPNVPAIPAAATLVADLVHVVDDESLSFVIRQGSRRWAIGDVIYVDSFAWLDDQVFRSEVYPYLANANLSIRTIGGR